MLVVPDTNVLVSGLLTPTGYPARVLDAISVGRLRIAFDDRILGEWREVLLRPRFGFDPAHVGRLLDSLEQLGVHVVALPLRLELPDPFDQPFAEVAVAAGADVLVTGNSKDFLPVTGRLPVEVLTPRQLVERIAD